MQDDSSIYEANDALSDESEALEQGSVTEEALAQDGETQSEAETAETTDKKENSFKRFWRWLKAHENLRQMVFFIGFSLICFAIEYITFAILSACLKKVNEPFDWFLFKYDTGAGGKGGFIAFLVSNIIAQICTFVLNRKKTFNATNNIVISGIMYAGLVIVIILLNTWLGGVITDAIANTKPDNDAIATVGGYVGKFTGSFLSFVINFVGCKFLVMRNWGKKKSDVDVTDIPEVDMAGVTDISEPDALSEAASDVTEE